MKNNGTLSFDLPFCDDLKINKLFVSADVPKNFKYGDFEGMKEGSNSSGLYPRNAKTDDQSKSFYFSEPLVQSKLSLSVKYKEIKKRFLESKISWFL